MECSILFMGPVGSGKTQAIRSISDIDVLDTDVRATDETALLKTHTTVSMDFGTLNLGGGDKLRLLGAPGQARFDYMWDILVMQAQGVVVTIGHRAPDPIADLDRYLRAVEDRARGRQLPIVVCVTHTDDEAVSPIEQYVHYVKRRGCTVFDMALPVIEMDARERKHVRGALIAMVALLEIQDRFPRMRCAA